jgi:aspartate aminotransferase
MTAVASETYTSTSAPIQYAAVKAFQQNADIDQYLEQSRKILAALGKHLAAMLQAADVNVLTPEGGFYLFPDFEPYRPKLQARGITDSVEFCEQVLEDTGVAMLPGFVFGQPLEELTVRLAYVNFNGSEALDQAFKLQADEPVDEQFLLRYCPEPLTAIARVCDWLKAL